MRACIVIVCTCPGEAARRHGGSANRLAQSASGRVSRGRGRCSTRPAPGLACAGLAGMLCSALLCSPPSPPLPRLPPRSAAGRVWLGRGEASGRGGSRRATRETLGAEPSRRPTRAPASPRMDEPPHRDDKQQRARAGEDNCKHEHALRAGLPTRRKAAAAAGGARSGGRLDA